MIITNAETDLEIKEEIAGLLESMKNYVISLIKGEKRKVYEEIVPVQEKKSESTAFITKEKKYLDQYYALRHEICKDENGWESYNGAENKFDRDGEIIVILDPDKKVVGGARFMTSDAAPYLYSEIPNTDFTYENVFRKVGIDSSTFKYGEISSLVVDANYRDRSGTEKMMAALINRAKEEGCEYLVGVSFLSRCRNYRIAFNKLGYKLGIVMDFQWVKKELYNYVDTFPMIAKIK